MTEKKNSYAWIKVTGLIDSYPHSWNRKHAYKTGREGELMDVKEEKYVKGLYGIFTGTDERLPIKIINPKKVLSENEYRLYNLIRYNPKTLLEIRKQLYRIPVKGLEDVSDLDRMLRRLRQKGCAEEVPQRKGPQKWKAI